MIRFRCSGCKHAEIVPKENYFEKCPKCKLKGYLQYYHGPQIKPDGVKSENSRRTNHGPIGRDNAEDTNSSQVLDTSRVIAPSRLGYPITQKLKGGKMENKPTKRKFGESRYGKDIKEKAIELAKAGKSLSEIVTELNGPKAKAVQRYLKAANALPSK